MYLHTVETSETGIGLSIVTLTYTHQRRQTGLFLFRLGQNYPTIPRTRVLNLTSYLVKPYHLARFSHQCSYEMRVLMKCYVQVNASMMSC